MVLPISGSRHVHASVAEITQVRMANGPGHLLKTVRRLDGREHGTVRNVLKGRAFQIHAQPQFHRIGHSGSGIQYRSTLDRRAIARTRQFLRRQAPNYVGHRKYSCIFFQLGKATLSTPSAPTGPPGTATPTEPSSSSNCTTAGTRSRSSPATDFACRPTLMSTKRATSTSSSQRCRSHPQHSRLAAGRVLEAHHLAGHTRGGRCMVVGKCAVLQRSCDCRPPSVV